MNNKRQGLTIYGTLTIIFVVLKLEGVIDWSWLWVLSPMIIKFSIVLSLIILCNLISIKINNNKFEHNLEESKVKQNSKLNSLRIQKALANTKTKDVTESLILETDNKKEILRELKQAKKELEEAAKKEEEKKVSDLANNMIDDISTNIDLTQSQKLKLLKLYKKDLKKTNSNNKAITRTFKIVR